MPSPSTQRRRPSASSLPPPNHRNSDTVNRYAVRNSAVPRHPHALMLPALAANTSRHIGGISSVLEVVPPGCRQGGIKRCRPLVVSFGQSPYLVRCQSKLLKCRPEWLNGVDRIEELLAQLDG